MKFDLKIEGQKSENGAGVRVCVGDVWQVAKSRGEEPGLRGGGGDWRSCAAN